MASENSVNDVYCLESVVLFLPVVAPLLRSSVSDTYNLVHLLQHVGRQSCFFGCGKLVGGLKIAAKAHG